MACFLIPAAEAVVTSIVAKVIEKKENHEIESKIQNGVCLSEFDKERVSVKLKRLNGMLWGGSGLLAFEHLWHGEISPFFPFLTAAANSAQAAEMFHEMSTVGVSMAAIVTVAWGVITLVTTNIAKRAEKSAVTLKKEV